MDTGNDLKHDEPAPSPSGSISSGEIEDDDGEICEPQNDVELPHISDSDESAKKNEVEYYRRTATSNENVTNSGDQKRFDPKKDYRKPFLTAEEINSRVMKIPSSEILATSTDVGIRCLIADMHALDREQIRLANNRTKLLEEMRAMYKRELKSLKECFEEVKTLHERKNLNIMDSRVGQEVVKFLRNASAGDSIDKKSMAEFSTVSSVPGSSSHDLFPPTHSMIQNGDSYHSVPPYADTSVKSTCPRTPAVGPFPVPPPDTTVPPPKLPIPLLEDGLGASKSALNAGAMTTPPPLPSIPPVVSTVPKQSSSNMSAAVADNVGTVNGANRELLAPVPSDKDVPPNSYCQRVSSVAPNFPPPFGRFPVNISSFEPGPYPGPVFDFPLPSMYHSRMSMMDGAGVMPFDDMLYANGRCALPFNTDQPYPPFRYDCDDFSPGIDPIRIRHVYDLRKAQQRRQLTLQDGMSRDWKRDWQRPGQGTFKERRDRSPLARPKAVDSNSAVENGATQNAGSGESAIVVLDENSEPVSST